VEKKRRSNLQAPWPSPSVDKPARIDILQLDSKVRDPRYTASNLFETQRLERKIMKAIKEQS
jgi:hypothetical protein